MKRIKSGFTVVELLTVIAILALLVGILLPALTTVRNTAKEAKQKVQLTTIDMALVTFKNDYGDYPPSDGWDCGSNISLDYCGAEKLCEALVGWDLLGFHPKSEFTSDGKDKAKTFLIYDSAVENNLKERKGYYLELSTANAFRLGITGEHDGLFDGTGVLNPDPFVLCDAFAVKKVRVVRPLTNPPEYVAYDAGTPILYFKANTSSKTIGPPLFSRPYIYDLMDNVELIRLGQVKNREDHDIVGDLPTDCSKTSGDFIEYIMDLKVSTEERPWPYRPDSYILISAGVDGLYGTADDITNF